MEPARPRIADSVVLRILNTGTLDESVLDDVLGHSVAYRDLPATEAARIARSLRRDAEPPAQMRWR